MSQKYVGHHVLFLMTCSVQTEPIPGDLKTARRAALSLGPMRNAAPIQGSGGNSSRNVPD